MKIENDKDLAPLTTFGIPATAAHYAEYSSLRELETIVRSPIFLSNEVFHIGDGSNLLFTGQRFEGLVMRSQIKGITRYTGRDGRIFVIAGAGEKWSDLVDYTIEQGLGGLENLAGIPGTVGAAPVQNPGAYGMEASDCLYSVECFDLQTRKPTMLTADECRFGYRDSMFKHEGKGRYIVLRVSFLLTPQAYAGNLTYGPLAILAEKLGHRPTLREAADCVIETRNNKLPDPKKTGNAGSFFKNPVVSKGFYSEVIARYYPEMPVYPLSDGRVKLSAAWLIDHAGMKGARCGGAEVSTQQCLVIINRGDASAQDVVRLCDDIRRAVQSKFKVLLHREVNFVSTDMEITVMGSGTSKGVPEIGCGCEVCTSSDPHDKRLRTSLLVRTKDVTLLIDASPDFRQQALTYQLSDADALLVTHSHFDHIGGIEDLRPFCAQRRFPIYTKEDVASNIRQRLYYCFNPKHLPGVPELELHVVDNKPFHIDGVKITPIEVHHGKLPIFGYRIGRFAFITDAKSIPESEKWKLEDLDILIVNALRREDHFAHFTLQEALQLIEEIKPRRAYLTHFSHEMGLHSELAKELPQGVEPAYDGLIIHC